MSTLLLVAKSAVESDYKDQDFWRTCSMRVQRILLNANLASIAQFAEAAASCGFRDDELMYNIGDTILERLSDMDTDSLAAMLRAHFLLRFRNDRIVLRLQDALYDHMEHSRTTPGGLSKSLLSLAKMASSGLLGDGILPRADLTEAANRMVTEHVAFFSSPQLCEVLEVQVHLGKRGNPQISLLLSNIADTLVREAGSLNGEQCAVALHAFAKCRVHDERLVGIVADRLRKQDVRSELEPEQLGNALYGFATFSCQDTAILDLLTIEARRALHLMNAPLMSRILSSVAKSGISSEVLTSRAALQVRRKEPGYLDEASNQELGALAMAFGKLQAQDGDLFSKVGEAYLRRTAPSFTEESCENLINIIHAFTKVHVWHQRLFKQIGDTLVDRAEEVNIRMLVRYLHAVAKIDYQMPPHLRHCIVEKLQAEKMKELGVFDLLKLSTAVRRLGIQVSSLETLVKTVLPNESDAVRESMGTRKRPVQKKRKMQSTRKRKWTW